MSIYKFTLESVRVIRRRNWAKRQASQYLKNGRYILMDEHKGFMRCTHPISHLHYLCLFIIGHAFTANGNNEEFSGTKILFATMGREMRVLDQENSQLITIFRDKKRLEYLLAKRSINLPLEAPRIIKRINDLAFSEELISTPKPHYISSPAFKKLLTKYISYYNKLPRHFIKQKIAPQHRDLHKDNILWVNGDPKYFIDYEDVQNDWYLRDLVTLMMYEGTASCNWQLLDYFFTGEFDNQFKKICTIFGDKFSENNYYKYLSKCINDRYGHADLDSQPDLKQRIDATIERYKNHSNKKAPKRCVFSTADENYALYAGAALLSAQLVDPAVDVFVIGKKFSTTTKTALSSKGINYIELSDKEQVKLNSDYTAESYYYFSMPEYFFQLGYDYSAYIDADILVVNKFQQGFPEDKAFAGSSMSGTTYEKILKDKLPILEKHYPINVDIKEDRIHSGVLFFNNKICAQIKFKNKLTKLSNQINTLLNAPIRDNEFLTIFQVIYGNDLFKKLPESYNYIEDISPNTRRIRNQKIRLYHFTYRTPKPWSKMAKRRILWLFGSPRRFTIAHRWRKYSKKFTTILQSLIVKDEY